jgi:hypothetical protein
VLSDGRGVGLVVVEVPAGDVVREAVAVVVAPVAERDDEVLGVVNPLPLASDTRGSPA